MNKIEFFKQLKMLLPIIEEEYNKLWDEEQKLLSDKGFKGDELEKATIARIHIHYKRQLNPSIKAEKFTGLVIGITEPTDFGARKQYEEAVALRDSNKEEAISLGYIDSEGHPVYQVPAWKKGRKIDLEKDKSKILYLLAKKDDPNDTFKLSELTLNYDQYIDIDEDGNVTEKEIPLFTPVEFRANVSKNSTDDKYLLNSSVVTQLVKMEDKQVPVSFIEKITNIIHLNDLKTWHQENLQNPRRFVITKGNINRLNVTPDTSRSNVIELDDANMELSTENIETVTCWLPKSHKIDWVDGALGLIVTGRTTVNNDGRLHMQVYGVLADDIWKNGILHMPKKITMEGGD